ncbi:hypothetical protein RND81_10G152600 [Saponaria officinalis]|uniref:Uncharacterized protein n=1 Tax=Saponaria officinalis TaxID=3572 RepID=A0AAW1I4U0_SAPOF
MGPYTTFKIVDFVKHKNYFFFSSYVFSITFSSYIEPHQMPLPFFISSSKTLIHKSKPFTQLHTSKAVDNRRLLSYQIHNVTCQEYTNTASGCNSINFNDLVQYVFS